MSGMKFNAGKVRIDLVPPEIIMALAAVWTYGTAKYEARNWEKGIDYSSIYASAQRHALAFWSGENIDPESSLPHLWHWLCNVAMLTHFSLFPSKYLCFDDRPKYAETSALIDAMTGLERAMARSAGRFGRDKAQGSWRCLEPDRQAVAPPESRGDTGQGGSCKDNAGPHIVEAQQDDIDALKAQIKTYAENFGAVK